MRLTTVAVALSLLMGSAVEPATAGHGRPMWAISKQRAAEACADMAHGAPKKWAIKTNLQTGLKELASIKGEAPSEQQAAQMTEQYANYMQELCPDRLKGGSNHESKPGNEEKHQQTLPRGEVTTS